MIVVHTEAITVSPDGEDFINAIEQVWRQQGLGVKTEKSTTAISIKYTRISEIAYKDGLGAEHGKHVY